MRRYTLVCEERLGRQIEGLAAEYGITEQEVIRQLVETGLEHLECEGESVAPDRGAGSRTGRR